MRDPLDELKNLTGATSGPALPAAEVRRRGDRMRRRRTAVQALGAAAAVAVIVSGGALATGVTSTAPRPVDPAAPTASTSPTPTPAPSTAPVVTSEIPEDFPLARGIDVPDGVDATDLQRDDATDQSWYALPCTGSDQQVTFAGDDKRTAARRVQVEGDFWGKSRQLLVYEDLAAANRAFTGLSRSLTACAESGETAPGARPMDWSVENMPGNADTPSWVIAQGSATGDGSHAFFVDLTATQVGRSIFVSRSGRSQEERLEWQRLEDSHDVVLRAAWCLWMEGPCGDKTEVAPPETASTDEPASFENATIARGLPKPGGDVPRWAWSEGEPLSPVACGGAEDLPAEPTGSYRVEVSPPDENAWRHLLVFEDEQAAVATMEQLRSSVVVCNEILGTPADDPTDPSEMRWSLEELDGIPVVLKIDGLVYADGTDTRVPGRKLTRAVQVGRAVLVAQLSDASSVAGEDAAAAKLTADAANIAGEMCIFTDGGCETG